MINQALTKIHAAPEELGPPVISAGSGLIKPQDAADVVGNRAADLPRHHRLSLAHAFPARLCR